MGGLVVAGTAAFLHPPVDRIILSGALLQVPSNTPGWMRWLARLMSPLGARVSMASGLDAEGISRDPEVVRRYLADPLVEDKLSACFAAGMMAMTESVQSAPAQIERPILILHGEDDPICNAEGSRRFYEGLSPGVAPGSALEVYPGLRHEIFNEPERESVWQDMLDWQASRAAGSESG
jgi:alpha-beta hydrolase superfamily lysophospholipase